MLLCCDMVEIDLLWINRNRFRIYIYSTNQEEFTKECTLCRTKQCITENKAIYILIIIPIQLRTLAFEFLPSSEFKSCINARFQMPEFKCPYFRTIVTNSPYYHIGIYIINSRVCAHYDPKMQLLRQNDDLSKTTPTFQQIISVT